MIWLKQEIWNSCCLQVYVHTCYQLRCVSGFKNQPISELPSASFQTKAWWILIVLQILCLLPEVRPKEVYKQVNFIFE